MESHSSLYMSFLFVVGFVCLHFYEEDLTSEVNAHNYVLKKIVNTQKEYVEPLFNYFGLQPQFTNVEYTRTQILESDYDRFNNVVNRRGELSKTIVIELLQKYDVEHSLALKGARVSLITQKSFYDKIEDQLNEIHKELLERERLLERNNVKVIIKEREASYDINEVYDLKLQPVVLNNNYLDEVEMAYSVHERKYTIQNFPLEFSNMPDSIILFLKGNDPVTGRKFSLKERHSLDLKKTP